MTLTPIMAVELDSQFHDANKTENTYPQSNPTKVVPAEEVNKIVPKTHIT